MKNYIYKILSFLVLTFSYIEAFAYKNGRGKLDSETSDFSMAVMAVFGIIVGGAFSFFVIYNLFKNGVKEEDKELNKMGCMAFLAVMAAFLLLASMCSN